MTNRYVASLAMALSLLACSPGVEPGTSSNPQECMIATYRVASKEDDLFASETKFEYDSQNRLSKQTYGNGVEQTYTYDGDKVVIKSGSNTVIGKLDEGGRLLESANEKSADKGSKFVYDSNGYLIRHESDGTGSSVKKYIYEYTYVNGNVSERKYSTMGQSGTISLYDRTTYEYYDKLNLSRLQILDYSVPNGGPSLSGKTNRQLLKKQTVSGGAVYDYTYEFDNNGLVKKAVVTYSSGSSPSSRYYWFTYKCSK